MKREPTPEERNKIVQAIVARDRVGAINLFISIAECGLTEAQEFVKALTADVKSAQTEKTVGNPAKKGWFGLFLMLALGILQA